jgi:hypothetical protein
MNHEVAGGEYGWHVSVSNDAKVDDAWRNTRAYGATEYEPVATGLQFHNGIEVLLLRRSSHE